MADKNPTGPGSPGHLAAAPEDDYAEVAVLREVVFLYPESLTLEELIRQMTAASTEFPDIDRVRRAVRELTAAGLLHRVGDLVLPTRAAARFQELAEL
jgi:hypothetical protein